MSGHYPRGAGMSREQGHAEPGRPPTQHVVHPVFLSVPKHGNTNAGETEYTIQWSEEGYMLSAGRGRRDGGGGTRSGVAARRGRGGRRGGMHILFKMGGVCIVRGSRNKLAGKRKKRKSTNTASASAALAAAPTAEGIQNKNWQALLTVDRRPSHLHTPCQPFIHRRWLQCGR